MSETTSSPEPVTGPIGTTATLADERRGIVERRSHGRLNVVAAWVGIVAGVVFVVAVIFGTGFMLGASAGGGHHHGGGHRNDASQMHHQRQMFQPGPGGGGPATQPGR